MMKRIAIFSLLVGLGFSNKVIMNKIVDNKLEEARKAIREEHRSETPIPEIEKVYPFGFHWRGKVVSGRLDCRDGWARDMSTVVRTGNAILTAVEERLVLSLALGLEKLEFGFDHCQLSIEPIFSLVRNFTATVGKNSIHLQVSVALNDTDNCHPRLDSFNISEADDIQVHTGQGIASQIKDKIITALLAHYHEEVLTVINMELLDIAINQISNATICQQT
uniref:Lipid-binding serum glycoprotein N-terminal domain-containing protein n=1 Tax=Riptortus pedestris TaxID=329032 RepID=R4WCQ2_RIPPE|nr:unknown secreted protein [Riptortus pedestris]